MRSDGLKYPTFLVVALYERDGFHSSLVADSREELLKKVEQRTQKIKGLVACSTPFEGKWVAGLGDGLIPDVSLPPEWKEVLGFLDSKSEE